MRSNRLTFLSFFLLVSFLSTGSLLADYEFDATEITIKEIIVNANFSSCIIPDDSSLKQKQHIIAGSLEEARKDYDCRKELIAISSLKKQKKFNKLDDAMRIAEDEKTRKLGKHLKFVSSTDTHCSYIWTSKKKKNENIDLICEKGD